MNVFCMYALRETASGVFVDPRNFDFGDTFGIVSDFDEFTKRIRAAIADTGQNLQWDLVEYIDETSYTGPVGIFKKDSVFSYQSELRLALLPGYGVKHELEVGDLSDIVKIGASKDLRYAKCQRNPKSGDPLPDAKNPYRASAPARG